MQTPHNPLTANLVPHLAQRGGYMPTVGSFLVLDLPGEKVRAEVTQIVSRDAVIAELRGVIFGKGSPYKQGDIVPARRDTNEYGVETWRVVTDRELRQQEDNERFVLEETKRAEEQFEAERQAIIKREQDEIAKSLDRTELVAVAEPQAKPKRRKKGAA